MLHNVSPNKHSPLYNSQIIQPTGNLAPFAALQNNFWGSVFTSIDNSGMMFNLYIKKKLNFQFEIIVKNNYCF